MKSPAFTIFRDNATPNTSQESMKRIITVDQRSASPENEVERGRHHQDAFELNDRRNSTDTVRRVWVASTGNWWMIICFAILGATISFDAMVVVTILPDLSTILHGKPTNALWPATCYFLANAVMQHFSVAMSRVLGRRVVLFVSVAIFTVGNLLSCVAPLFPVLLVGRALQGIGSGGMVAIPLAVLTDMTALQQRAGYNGIILLVSALGALAGPVIGALFIEHGILWQWIFYITLPLCAILLLGVQMVVRREDQQLESKQQLWNVDWTGGTLFTGSMVSLLLGITWFGEEDSPHRWPTWVALGAGMGGLLGTMLYEKTGASKPFLSFPVVKKSSIAFTLIYIHSYLMFSQLYYIPVYLKAVQGFSSSMAAIFLIPITATALSATAAVGMLIARFRHYRWAMWLGWALNIASAGCTMLMDVHTSAQIYVPIFVAAGLGHGLTVSASHTAIQELADAAQVQDATLIASFLRTLGMCAGIAMTGVTFRNRLTHYLVALDVPREMIAARTAEVFLLGPADTPIPAARIETVRLAYALSFKTVVQGLTILAGIGGLLSLFVGWRARRR